MEVSTQYAWYFPWCCSCPERAGRRPLASSSPERIAHVAPALSPGCQFSRERIAGVRGGAGMRLPPSGHHFDEFPGGYSSAGCFPAEPACAAPTRRQQSSLSSRPSGSTRPRASSALPRRHGGTAQRPIPPRHTKQSSTIPSPWLFRIDVGNGGSTGSSTHLSRNDYGPSKSTSTSPSGQAQFGVLANAAGPAIRDSGTDELQRHEESIAARRSASTRAP